MEIEEVPSSVETVFETMPQWWHRIPLTGSRDGAKRDLPEILRSIWEVLEGSKKHMQALFQFGK